MLPAPDTALLTTIQSVLLMVTLRLMSSFWRSVVLIVVAVAEVVIQKPFTNFPFALLVDVLIVT